MPFNSIQTADLHGWHGDISDPKFLKLISGISLHCDNVEPPINRELIEANTIFQTVELPENISEPVSEQVSKPTPSENKDHKIEKKARITVDPIQLIKEKSFLETILNFIHSTVLFISSLAVYLLTFLLLPIYAFTDKGSSSATGAINLLFLIYPTFIVGFYLFLAKDLSKHSKKSLMHKFMPTKIIPLAFLLSFFIIFKPLLEG